MGLWRQRATFAPAPACAACGSTSKVHPLYVKVRLSKGHWVLRRAARLLLCSECAGLHTYRLLD